MSKRVDVGIDRKRAPCHQTWRSHFTNRKFFYTLLTKLRVPTKVESLKLIDSAEGVKWEKRSEIRRREDVQSRLLGAPLLK